MAYTVQEIIDKRTQKNKTAKDIKLSRGYIPGPTAKDIWSTAVDTGNRDISPIIKNSEKRIAEASKQDISDNILNRLYGNSPYIAPTQVDLGKKAVVGTLRSTAGALNTVNTLIRPNSADSMGADELFKAASSLDETTDLRGLDKTFGNIAESAPLTLAAAFSGPGGIPLIMASAGGQKAYEAKQAGATPTQQKVAGLISGAVEGITETVSLGAFKQLLGIGGKSAFKEGAKKVVKTFIKEVGGEAIGEAVATAMDPVATQVYENDALKSAYVDNLDKTLLDIANSGITGGLSAIVMGGTAMGIQSTKAYTNNQTTENLNTVLNDMEQKGVVIPEETRQEIIQQNETKQDVKQKVNYNTMSISKLKEVAKTQGIDTNGLTKGQIRTELQAKPVVQKSEAIQGDLTQLNNETDTIVPKQVETTEIVQPQVETVNNIQQQVNQYIDNMNQANIVESQDKISNLLVENMAEGASVQVFVNELQDIKDLSQIGLQGEQVAMLKKHQKMFEEMQAKGITKASTNELRKLIAIKDKVKMLKVKHQDKINAIRDKQKQRDLKRKESTMSTKLLVKIKRLLNSKQIMPETKAMAKEIFGDIDLRAKSMSNNTLIKLESLKEQIDVLDKSGEYVPESMIDAVSRLDNRRIGDMSAEQVTELTDIVNTLDNLRKEQNKARTISETQTKKTLITEMVDTIGQTEGARSNRTLAKKIIDTTVGLQASMPKTVLYKLDKYKDGAFTKSFNALRNGANNSYNLMFKLEDQLSDLIGNPEGAKNTKEWKATENINGIDLTSGEKIYLKATLRDEHLSNSVEQKGVTTKESSRPTLFTREQLEAIQLNEMEQKIYDAIDPILYDTGKLFSKAYAELEGSTKEMQDPGKYLPKFVDKLYRQQKVEASALGNTKEILTNSGMLKERVKSTNIVKIPDILDVLNSHIKTASAYAGIAKPIRDFNNTVLSPQVRLKLQEKEGVSKNGKSPTENYFEELLLNLQGVNETIPKGDIDSVVKKITNNFIIAKLGLRVSTILKQTASFSAALPILDIDSLIYGLKNKTIKGEAQRYNARAKMRDRVKFDRDTTTKNKILEKTLLGITKADELTINKLWVATEHYVSKNNPGLKGEALSQETSKLFDNVLDTQPNYTVLDQSGLNRNKSIAARMVTLFSSARNAQFNQLKRSVNKAYYTGDIEELSKALIGFIISIAIVSIVDVGRRKLLDKDTNVSDKVMANVLGIIPVVNEAYGLFDKGYGISLPAADVINSVASSWNQLKNASDSGDSDRIKKASIRLFGDLSDMTGVPVKNLIENKEMITNLLTDKEE